MGPILYDKTPKYGDINKGFAVSAQIAAMCPTMIDLANPAVVKYARIILGTDEATRDSIDDIASYAAKTGGSLSAVQDLNLPQVTQDVMALIEKYVDCHTVSPVILAYVSAILAAVGRGSKQLAFELILEYSDYLSAAVITTADSYVADIVSYAAQLTQVLDARAKEEPKQEVKNDI